MKSMDDFSIRVSTYLEKIINVERMKEHEFSIIETKSIPVIVNPSAVCWSESPTDYTDVQIDFDFRTADMFDDILERCRGYMSMANYEKAQSIRRFAFPVLSFEYNLDDTRYFMPKTRIVGQLVAPLIETSGAGLQLIVTGRTVRRMF